MKKKCIYTVNIDHYDKISSLPLKFKENWDAYLITNDPDEKVDGWKTVIIDDYIKDVSKDVPSVVISRHPKFNPHIYFADYDYYLYIDGNRQVIKSLDEIYEQFKNFKFVSMPHKNENYKNIYSELRTCIRHPRSYLVNRKEKLLNCIKDYKKELFPALSSPNLDNSIIFRSNKSININKLIWNEFLYREIYRDQIATRYIYWKYNLKNEINISEKHFCKFSDSKLNDHIFKFNQHIRK